VVTLVYRRGPESMSATDVEQDFAKTEGVHVVHYAQPRRLVTQGGVLAGIEFEYTAPDVAGALVGSGEYFTLAADTVLKAIGQVLRVEGGGQSPDVLALSKGRIRVDDRYRTSVPGVWAGGDCVGGKVDLTVQAVEDGKRAARAIHSAISSKA
jgi:dihydropyrimidine dehydrogenase (NAD+) subunit PreT